MVGRSLMGTGNSTIMDESEDGFYSKIVTTQKTYGTNYSDNIINFQNYASNFGEESTSEIHNIEPRDHHHNQLITTNESEKKGLEIDVDLDLTLKFNNFGQESLKHHQEEEENAKYDLSLSLFSQYSSSPLISRRN